MTIDTSGLKNWANTAALANEAENLKTHGTHFKNAISSAKSSWLGLNHCYHSPHADLLYSSLDVPENAAQDVATGSGTIEKAITNFIAQVRPLETQVPNLLTMISNFEAADNVCYAVGTPEQINHDKQKESLQSKVDTLAQQYQEAVDTCVQDLGNIKADGTQRKPGEEGWKNYARGTMIGIGTLGSEALKVRVTRYRARGVIRVFGRDFKTARVPLFSSRSYHFQLFGKNFWKWQGFKGFRGRFLAAIKESFLGPPKGKFGSWSKPTGGPKGKRFGAGVEKTSSVKNGTSTLGRTAARGFFVLGSALTYKGEYDAAQERLKATHPELSPKERRAKAAELSAVRGTGQIATITGATGVGTVICPGVGTAIGFGAGALFMIPTGGGKNLGDRVGDISEWSWEKGKWVASKAWGAGKWAASKAWGAGKWVASKAWGAPKWVFKHIFFWGGDDEKYKVESFFGKKTVAELEKAVAKGK